MDKLIKAIALAGLLAGCSATAQSERTIATVSDQEAFARARLHVTENLKDPDSARFGTSFVRKTHMLGLAADRVCGTVNGRNSFGGYTGMQMFVYYVANDGVLIGDAAQRQCVLDLP